MKIIEVISMMSIIIRYLQTRNKIIIGILALFIIFSLLALQSKRLYDEKPNILSGPSDWELFLKLTNGMTRADVELLLGRPYTVNAFDLTSGYAAEYGSETEEGFERIVCRRKIGIIYSGKNLVADKIYCGSKSKYIKYKNDQELINSIKIGMQREQVEWLLGRGCLSLWPHYEISPVYYFIENKIKQRHDKKRLFRIIMVEYSRNGDVISRKYSYNKYLFPTYFP